MANPNIAVGINTLVRNRFGLPVVLAPKSEPGVAPRFVAEPVAELDERVLVMA